MSAMGEYKFKIATLNVAGIRNNTLKMQSIYDYVKNHEVVFLGNAFFSSESDRIICEMFFKNFQNLR